MRVPTIEPVRRPLAALLVAGLAVALAAAPAAAKQQIGPRVKVEGTALPAPDEETFATSDDRAIGRTPPTLVGEGFKDQAVTIEHGEAPRIVIFLSHSCPHCQAEVPVIVDLADEGVFDGIDIQTVTTNTSRELSNFPPSKWLKREQWPFKPILADDRRLRSLVAMGGTSFPYMVFVDADGTVAGRWSGELGASTWRGVAQALVEGRSLYE
jgi:thiol-disulfide isomerase/thioredoxin